MQLLRFLNYQNLINLCDENCFFVFFLHQNCRWKIISINWRIYCLSAQCCGFTSDDTFSFFPSFVQLHFALFDYFIFVDLFQDFVSYFFFVFLNFITNHWSTNVTTNRSYDSFSFSRKSETKSKTENSKSKNDLQKWRE